MGRPARQEFHHQVTTTIPNDLYKLVKEKGWSFQTLLVDGIKDKKGGDFYVDGASETIETLKRKIGRLSDHIQKQMAFLEKKGLIEDYLKE